MNETEIKGTEVKSKKAEIKGKNVSAKDEIAFVHKGGNRPKYSLNELAQRSIQIFNVPKECVVAAFQHEEKKEATVDEAVELIKCFMKKEVK